MVNKGKIVVLFKNINLIVYRKEFRINNLNNFFSIKGNINKFYWFKYTNKIVLFPKNIRNRRLIEQWGTYLTTLKNGIYGILKGFRRILCFIGNDIKVIGIRDNMLLMELGYSNINRINIDKRINVNILKEGKELEINGINNIDIGNFIGRIKQLRKNGVYKKRGIYEKNELVKLKIIRKK